jgi:LytS/YehU family sensor histidine kinase
LNQNKLDAATRKIDELTSVMRHALQAGADHTVPIADEIAVVRACLGIEQIRFEQRLRAHRRRPRTRHGTHPPMALQTLADQ